MVSSLYLGIAVPKYRMPCRNTTVVGSCLLSPLAQGEPKAACPPHPTLPTRSGRLVRQITAPSGSLSSHRPLLSQGCLVCLVAVAVACRKRSFLAHPESTHPSLLRYQSHPVSDSGPPAFVSVFDPYSTWP